MIKIAVMKSEYVRDTQIYTGNPEQVNPWDSDNWNDVKSPNLYLGIGTGDTEGEIKMVFAAPLGVSPDTIMLYDLK